MSKSFKKKKNSTASTSKRNRGGRRRASIHRSPELPTPSRLLLALAIRGRSVLPPPPDRRRRRRSPLRGVPEIVCANGASPH
ncbi:hypothetical protein DAI22_11g153400 [Oryza sativa Japonica Group]|nr:hypothetical protein DAI22_11g153400 [Oryza sativa Japonica Group]